MEKEPKRVLQIIAELGNGGVESMIMNIYRNIDRNKVQFDFIAHNENNKYLKEIEDLGGRIFFIEPMSKIGIIKYSKNLYKILIENKDIKVVHAHILLQNAIILTVARMAKVKTRISHSHLTSMHSLKSKLVSPILKLLISINATEKIACGIDAGKLLYGKNKFKVLNNAIELEKFTNVETSKSKFKEENNIDESTILIGHVGRFVTQKNHKFIINLAKSLKMNYGLKTKIFLVGDGPMLEFFKEEVDNNSLNDIVTFLGARNDINELLHNFDVFILPSLFEGLPVILVESQAAGLPSVISSTITNEVDLGINLIKSISLEEDMEIWVKSIIEQSKIDLPSKEEIIEAFKERKYDIKSSLESVYRLYDISN